MSLPDLALCKSERPLILPGAFDALSARLIKQAGFKAYFTGGFPTIGARWGLPDIGLVALGEIASAVTDIVKASDLPVMVDGDNGYGDVKNVVHVLHTYERLGVSAIMFEDQVAPKRCGHIAGKDVIPAAEMAAKIRAASRKARSTATPSSSPAPTRATCWASTRRSAAPSSISKTAPTASSSSRRMTWPSSS